MVKLVEDWKDGWKFWSVQLGAAGMGLLTFADFLNQVLMTVPPVLGMKIPHAQSLGLVLIGAGLISRFLKQGTKKNEKTD